MIGAQAIFDAAGRAVSRRAASRMTGPRMDCDANMPRDIDAARGRK
jgi:hypothetical protein